VVRLKADFSSDLIAHTKHLLKARWGSEIDQIKDRDILIYFRDSLRRQIATCPREVKIASDFRCPPGRESDWNTIQEKVRKGEDLGPHLSEGHSSLFNWDGLLNEWGVHHFHIGTLPYPKNPYYVARDGPLVFALVGESTFYAINFYTHKDFEKLSIVESLHKHWPDVIGKYRQRGIPGENLTEKQRRTVRGWRSKKKRAQHGSPSGGGQAAVTTQDGTIYGSIGGPVSGAGTTYDSVSHADQWLRDIRQL
jgi:hypothetical protein